MSIRYTFDELNRLIVRDPADRLRPTRVLEGRATTDAKNRLRYRVEDSSRPAQGRDPHQIELEGAWKLTPAHDLAFTLRQTQEHERQTVYLKGDVVEARAHALGFALRRQGRDEEATSQRLMLHGRWAADAKNRLTFLAEQADGSEDRLTFQGGWELGKHHEILYRYRQHQRHSDRSHAEQTLVFSGAWDVAARNRLVYRLAGSSDSVFEFKASLQSPSLVAREGRLVYQVGVGVSGGRTRRQQVTLFGAWKLNRDLSISFEIPYANGRVGSLTFEGTYALSSRNRIAVALRSREGTPLGVTVTFTKDVVPDTQLFLRLRKDAEEQSVLGGIQVRF